MAIRIRKSALADLDALVALVRRANLTYRDWAGGDWSPPDDDHERRHWRERIADPDAWAALAEDDGGLVGCVDFARADAPGVAHVSRLFVVPDRWRNGIGSALCREAIREMRRRGFHRAGLFVPIANASARAFYERHGWEPTGETREWRGLQLLRYTLAIAPEPT